MDMIKTVREIGFFETGINLGKVISSEDVKTNVGAFMPLPDENLLENNKAIAKWLISFDKSKYMFLSPEIAIIEEIAALNNKHEAIIVVPCDIDTEVKERLKGNLPKKIKVSLLEEPYFPDSFFPGNGILVVCGYMAGDRMMVLPETYRMIEHYSGFWGKKLFIPYINLSETIRYENWMEIDSGYFSSEWGESV